MNFFTNAIDAIAGSLMNGTIPGLHNGQAAPSVESLCRANNWSVDESDGDIIRLHFCDGQGRTRKLRIDYRPGSSFLLLSSTSFSDPEVRDVPAEILAWLLHRNAELLTGAWEIHPLGDDRVRFLFTYAVLAAGLNPAIFRGLCETIIRECAQFDQKMRQAGLLS